MKWGQTEPFSLLFRSEVSLEKKAFFFEIMGFVRCASAESNSLLDLIFFPPKIDLSRDSPFGSFPETDIRAFINTHLTSYPPFPTATHHVL